MHRFGTKAIFSVCVLSHQRDGIETEPELVRCTLPPTTECPFRSTLFYHLQGPGKGTGSDFR